MKKLIKINNEELFYHEDSNAYELGGNYYIVQGEEFYQVYIKNNFTINPRIPEFKKDREMIIFLEKSKLEQENKCGNTNEQK